VSHPGRRITLLYFAAIKDRLGSEGEELELPEGVERVADLARLLPLLRPKLRGVMDSVRFAVGDELAGPEHAVRAGDVVALLPPVSGG
jgi:molybdopterin converting factor subunit 1